MSFPFDGLHNRWDLWTRAPSFIIKKDGDYTVAIDDHGQVRFIDKDAATVIQSATNAIQETDTATILIKIGVYDCYENITIKDKNIRLIGESAGTQGTSNIPGSKLRFSSGKGIVISSVDYDIQYPEVSDLQIVQVDMHTGTGISMSGSSIIKPKITRVSMWGFKTGIYLNRAWVGELRGLHIVNCDIGVELYGNLSNIKIADSSFSKYGTIENTYGIYIHENDARSNVVENCHFEPGSNAIDVYLYGDTVDNLIIGNVFGNGSSVGVKIETTSALDTRNNIVHNLFRCGQGERTGVKIVGNAYGNRIDNNSFEYNANYPIETGVYTEADETYIIRNYFYQIANPVVLSGNPDVVIKDNFGYVTENDGVATFSGDGSTITFQIPHGLASTPSKYDVSPLTPDAHGSKTVTADDTYITITFDTAPPSGTDNIKFGWWAKV